MSSNLLLSSYHVIMLIPVRQLSAFLFPFGRKKEKKKPVNRKRLRLLLSSDKGSELIAVASFSGYLR